jgi:hypothetical protein
MLGMGQSTIEPYEYRSFIITMPPLESNIPTVSEWGLIGMTLLLLTAGTIALRYRGAVMG